MDKYERSASAINEYVERTAGIKQMTVENMAALHSIPTVRTQEKRIATLTKVVNKAKTRMSECKLSGDAAHKAQRRIENLTKRLAVEKQVLQVAQEYRRLYEKKEDATDANEKAQIKSQIKALRKKYNGEVVKKLSFLRRWVMV